jgi:hypothetical protein
MMATQQIWQTKFGGRRAAGGRMLGIALAALVTLLVAGWLTLSVAAPRAAFPAATQPVVGRSALVTGLVFDGTRYTHAPIAVGASAQPVIGRSVTITAPVFDGTTYRTTAIRVAGPSMGAGYRVTALIFDGSVYRSAPVRVSGQ